MSPLNPLQTSISTSIALGEIVEGFSLWRQLRKDVKSIVRLFYLETRKNLDIIGFVKLDNKSDANTSDSDYLKITEMLDIDILSMVFFYGEKSTRLYELLKKRVHVIIKKKDSEDEVHLHNIFTILAFLSVKINSMKKLSKAGFTGKAHRSFRYRTRLMNINKAYIELLHVMENMDEVKEIIINKH